MGRLSGTKRRKKWSSKFGKPSIGSQVGGDLGRHLSKLSKQGKLGSKYAKQFQNDKGNLTFSGFKNLLSGFFGGKSYADTMGQVTGKSVLRKNLNPNYVKRMEKLNLDVTNPQPGLKWTINNQIAINNIKNEKVRNWLNKNIPKAVKDWKINHQMHYTPKIKPGDPRWTPQGTGKGPKLDKDTEKYFEWLARANPEGKTISDYNKLYKKQLDSGMDLFTAMKFNPAETGNFYALIDDTKDKKNTTQSTADLLKSGKTTADLLTVKNNNSTTNNTMALNQAQVNKLYNEMLGRDAVFGDASDYDADYWVGKTADQVKSGIQGSSEYKNRAALVAGAGDAGISEADLDKMVLPGGLKTEHYTGYDKATHGDLFDFNAANNWGVPGERSEKFNAVKPILNILGATAANDYSTTPGTGGGGVNDGSTLPITPSPTPTPGGWWTKFADADAFKKFLMGDQQKSDGMDDFMKFMMLMSVMPRGGGGGGYGGSQYGYGGLNPGGVQAAYNPWENMKSGMDFFKNNFGSGATTSTISTGN